jgi:hypothetical protein
VECWVKAKKTIRYDSLPIVGGRYEEKRKDKSFEGSPEEKECQKFIEKIEGGKKVPHLIPSLRGED